MPRVNFQTVWVKNPDELTIEEWRVAIREQTCPICDRGPFVVLANHVSRAHNIDRRALREYAFLLQREVACDPEYSHRLSQDRKGIGPKPGSNKGHKHILNSAARAAQRKRSLTPKALEAKLIAGRKAAALRTANAPKNKCPQCGKEVPSWRKYCCHEHYIDHKFPKA